MKIAIISLLFVLVARIAYAKVAQIPKCGPHEYNAECGDTCGLTCENYENDLIICTQECRVNQCDCVEGYVRREAGGPCILLEECSSNKKRQVCGPHEYVPECGDTCGLTCENYQREDLACTMECRRNQCDCVEGYVRREAEGPCIPEEECPSNDKRQVCGPHEYLAHCGDTCGYTCENYRQIFACTRECRRNQCDCVEGYVRREAGGPCIRKDDCP